MKSAFLLRHITLYPLLKRYQCIKDIPQHERQFRPVRLDFRLWGLWYVPQTQAGLSLVDGGSMAFHTMHALDGERVIGPHDLEAAANTKYAESWRASYAETISERIKATIS